MSLCLVRCSDKTSVTEISDTHASIQMTLRGGILFNWKLPRHSTILHVESDFGLMLLSGVFASGVSKAVSRLN